MTNPFAVLHQDQPVKQKRSTAPKEEAAPVAAAPVAQEPQQKKAPRAASAAPASEGAVDTTGFVQARSEGRGRGGRRGGRGGRGAAAGGRPPKREFERHSGTGRGREVSKGGAGSHNWGKAGEETAAAAVVEGAEGQQQQRPARRPRGPRRAAAEGTAPAAEGETAAPAATEAAPAAEGEAAPATDAAAAPAAEKKPEEEEDTGISYAEYLKQQAEKRKALPTKEARKAGEGVVIDSKVNKFSVQVKKDNEEVLRIKTEAPAAVPAAGVVGVAPKKDKNVKLDASEYFTGGISGPAPRDWSEERPAGRGGRGGARGGSRGGDRPARGGRGGAGQQQRGPRRQQAVAAPLISDANAFPSL